MTFLSYFFFAQARVFFATSLSAKRIFVLQCKRNKDKDSAFRLPSLITIVWILNDWCVNITIKLSFPTCFSNRTACNWCSIIKADIYSRCDINKYQHQLILWSAQLSMMMNLKTMRWCLHSVKHIKATYRYLMHSYFICPCTCACKYLYVFFLLNFVSISPFVFWWLYFLSPCSQVWIFTVLRFREKTLVFSSNRDGRLTCFPYWCV